MRTGCRVPRCCLPAASGRTTHCEEACHCHTRPVWASPIHFKSQCKENQKGMDGVRDCCWLMRYPIPAVSRTAEKHAEHPRHGLRKRDGCQRSEDSLLLTHISGRLASQEARDPSWLCLFHTSMPPFIGGPCEK